MILRGEHAAGGEVTVKTLADGSEAVVRLDEWLQTA